MQARANSQQGLKATHQQRSGCQGVMLTFLLASSSERVGTTMHLSPCCQLTGVATEWLAVSCRLSIALKICSSNADSAGGLPDTRYYLLQHQQPCRQVTYV